MSCLVHGSWLLIPIAVLVPLPFISYKPYSKIRPVPQKHLFLRLLLSCQKKYWRMWPHQSIFWYDTNLYHIICEGYRWQIYSRCYTKRRIGANPCFGMTIKMQQFFTTWLPKIHNTFIQFSIKHQIFHKLKIHLWNFKFLRRRYTASQYSAI